MSVTIHLDFMDLNSAAESVTLSVGVVFSGAVEPYKIEQACAKLAKVWPILGAYIGRNDQVSSGLTF
jgi:hypothetical protein